MFATIPATFALANIAIFDMVFALFLFGAVGCLLVAAKQPSARIELCGYGLLTLAVMTKGPVALLLVALLLAAAFVASNETRAQVRGLHWRVGLPSVAIAASPWFVWMGWRFGGEFVRGYLLAGNLWYLHAADRVFRPRDQSHVLPACVCRRVLPVERRCRRPWRRPDPSCSLRSFTLERGSAPLALGPRRRRLFQRCALQARSLHLPGCPRLLPDCGARVAGGGQRDRWALVGHEVQRVRHCRTVDHRRKLWRSVPVEDRSGAAGGRAFAAARVIRRGVGLLFQAERRHWGVPAGTGVLVTTLLVCYATVVVVGFPALEQVRPMARVARILARSTPPAAPVGLYRLERWRGSLRYMREPSGATTGDNRRGARIPSATQPGLCRPAPPRLPRASETAHSGASDDRVPCRGRNNRKGVEKTEVGLPGGCDERPAARLETALLVACIRHL